MEIIPALLTNDPKELKGKISQVEGLVGRVQIDIVDGVFANNKTVGLEELEGLVDTSLLLDVQLMVKDPIAWVERCARIKSVDRIIGHIEMMENWEEFVKKVRETGKKVGLGIDLPTLKNEVDPEVLKELKPDVILLMAVKAGFGGQEFDESVLEKIANFDCDRNAYSLNFKICVDGGINIENIKQIAESGADEVAIGHSLWEGEIKSNIVALQAAVTGNM